MVEHVDADSIKKYVVELGEKNTFKAINIKVLIDKPDLQDTRFNLAVF